MKATNLNPRLNGKFVTKGNIGHPKQSLKKTREEKDGACIIMLSPKQDEGKPAVLLIDKVALNRK